MNKINIPNHLAAEFRARLGDAPDWAIVAGSGLAALGRVLEHGESLAYESFAHIPRPTVVGHAGELIFGRMGAARVAVFCGRRHAYEGGPAEETLRTIRAIADWGCPRLILTNAAGGVNSAYRPGDLMLIADHLNLMFQGMQKSDETRKPHWTHAYYDPAFREHARACASQLAIPLYEGIYAANLGPAYETPAEARLLQWLGADAVGMSTVPEAILAHRLGLRVLAISSISNSLFHKTDHQTTHEEVLANSSLAVGKMVELIKSVISHQSSVITETCHR